MTKEELIKKINEISFRFSNLQDSIQELVYETKEVMRLIEDLPVEESDIEEDEKEENEKKED